VTVEIPPLRERCEDIPLLAESFARRRARYNRPARRIAPAALRRLMEYDYPGNVRELRNIIERAVVLAEDDELTAKDLPEEIKEKPAENRPCFFERTGKRRDSRDPLRLPYTANLREDGANSSGATCALSRRNRRQCNARRRHSRNAPPIAATQTTRTRAWPPLRFRRKRKKMPQTPLTIND
jgi:DNA-binding NtrC family response regulator